MKNDVSSIGVIVADSNYREVGAFYTKVRPDINNFISDKALEVSGFSRDQLSTFIPRRDAIIKFMHFLKPYVEATPQTMVSHTVNNFDYRFVDWMFRKEDLHFSLYRIIHYEYQLSTIKMGREAGHATNSLEEWASRLKLSFNHHNALDDARMCYNIFKCLSQ